MPSLDPTAILLDVLVGGIGLGLFMYGRKAVRIPHIATGLLLMVYPYFTPTAIEMVVVGVLIGLGFWAALWLGW